MNDLLVQFKTDDVTQKCRPAGQRAELRQVPIELAYAAASSMTVELMRWATQEELLLQLAIEEGTSFAVKKQTGQID